MPAKTINAIIKCSECEGLLVWQTSLLGIRYPGILWTDLKYESMNDEEPFIKCPHCSKVFEPREANVVEMKKFLDFNLEENEVACDFPVFEDYIDILKNRALSNELEKKIRIAAVHAFNDNRRDKKSDLELTVEARENIIKLLPMCESPLFLAELHRELGNFEEAKKVIECTENKGTLIYDLINELIKQQSTKIDGVEY
ncbi:MAG: hypothetical protein IE909_11155 [Campylobacterales bacterium]|nr:hypothetical protein [Campylobacterales bacterium]